MLFATQHMAAEQLLSNCRPQPGLSFPAQVAVVLEGVTGTLATAIALQACPVLLPATDKAAVPDTTLLAGATGDSCSEPLKRHCVAHHHTTGFASALPPQNLSVPGWTASRCGGECCAGSSLAHIS